MTYYCQKCGRQQDYTACSHCSTGTTRVAINQEEAPRALHNLTDEEATVAGLVARCEIHKLTDTIHNQCERIEQLESALRQIAESKYCAYENTSGDQYGMGVTDGHRYCAKIAQDALAN